MDQNKMRALHLEIMDLGPESVSLPLPRRFNLTPLRLMNEEIMGPSLEFFKDHAMRESSSTDMLMELMDRKDLQNYFAGLGMTHSDLRMMHIRARHQYSKAPMFSVAPGLKLMLEDTGIKNNVPAKFFVAPFRTCYLEFEPAEDRRLLAMSKKGDADLVEGCYIQERQLQVPPPLSREDREFLEIDPQAPIRIVDVAFTHSPINSSNRQVQNAPAVIADKLEYIQIFIQDESEPIIDVLERSIDFSLKHGTAMASVDLIARQAFSESMRDNFSRLAKVLFYMHVERKSQVIQTPAKDLEDRIKGVGDKKRPKLERMLNRTYDRIVVGPMTYKPLAMRLEDAGAVKGTKTPHYRSGYFGIRWKGTGQAKMPELVRVKESIINEHLLSSRAERDYEIR